MVLACLACLGLYGRNVPQTEDWQLVTALTGNEPHLLRSLWAQTNEHRVPFPQLVLLGLLKLTHGDFRVGMALNVVLLATAAAALLHLAREVRGGVTRYADAFFPVGLLHLGNWDNLFWGWQVTQVIPTVLIIAVLYQLIRTPSFTTATSAGWGAMSLLLLPLSGANGLLFAPFLACWLAYCGLRQWRADGPPARRWIAGVLIGSAAVSLCLTGLYFVGYERPSWAPPNPGLRASILATAQFLALGFGPVARSSWALSIVAAALVLVPTAALAMQAALSVRGLERHRYLGILVFVISFAVFVLAIGWGRAGVIEVYRSWPMRYSLFALPAFVAAFFLWELYGGPRWRPVIQNTLLVGMLLLIPLNTGHGILFRNWYLAGADAVIRDLRAGKSASELAQEHGSYLNHSMDPASLGRRMLMLKAAGIAPWEQLPDNPSSTGQIAPARIIPVGQLAVLEIRYHRADAAEVFLVWGIDGWQVLTDEFLPTGTVIKEKVMHTPMAEAGGSFASTIRGPAGATIDYGFLTTRETNGVESTIWDGGYSTIARQGSATIERGVNAEADWDGAISRTDTQALVDREFRYRLPGAGEVFLVWGIDGWQTVPAAIESGTAIKDELMRTRMRRDGDVFTATVRVPAGAAMDYGFLITDRRGIFDLVSPKWDEQKDRPKAVADGHPIDIRSSIRLAHEWAEFRARWRIGLVGLLLLLGFWAGFYFSLGFVERYRP